MVGFIIGLIIGIIIFILQNFKPTSGGFRICFLLFTVAFLWGMSKVNLGYWNILLLPTGMMILCFITAVLFPYRGISAKQEYDAVNGRDYYNEIQDGETIGIINAPGFKQTYDRIISGLIFEMVRNQDQYQKIISLLYSKNFYPISEHTKGEILEHIATSLKPSTFPLREEDIKQVFNAYVSVMSIHDEATRAIQKAKAK